MAPLRCPKLTEKPLLGERDADLGKMTIDTFSLRLTDL